MVEPSRGLNIAVEVVGGKLHTQEPLQAGHRIRLYCYEDLVVLFGRTCG